MNSQTYILLFNNSSSTANPSLYSCRKMTVLLCLVLTTKEQLLCCASCILHITLLKKKKHCSALFTSRCHFCHQVLATLTSWAFFVIEAHATIINPLSKPHKSFYPASLIQNWGHLDMLGFIHAKKHASCSIIMYTMHFKLSFLNYLFYFFILHSLQYLSKLVIFMYPMYEIFLSDMSHWFSLFGKRTCYDTFK